MTTNSETTTLKAVRWIARILSSLIAIFLILFVFLPGISEMIKGTSAVDNDSILPIIFFALFIVFVVVAWFNEKLGGFLMVFWGACVIIYYIAIGTFIMGMVGGLPFLICGFLFLLYWKQNKDLNTNAGNK